MNIMKKRIGKKEIIKQIAKDRNTNKNEIYQKFLKNSALKTLRHYFSSIVEILLIHFYIFVYLYIVLNPYQNHKNTVRYKLL